jgi:hypothetical protein
MTLRCPRVASKPISRGFGRVENNIKWRRNAKRGCFEGYGPQPDGRDFSQKWAISASFGHEAHDRGSFS